MFTPLLVCSRPLRILAPARTDCFLDLLLPMAPRPLNIDRRLHMFRRLLAQLIEELFETGRKLIFRHDASPFQLDRVKFAPVVS